MERMTGADAMLLYLETLDSAHTLKVVVVDPARIGRSLTLDDLAGAVESCLPHYPRFRQRLVMSPGGLDHPWWVLDESFDLRAHLAARTVEPPGGATELDDVLSELAAQPMSRDRPLWDATLVDGLEEGRAAVVFRIHHCVTDGLGAIRAFEMLTSAEPGGRPAAPPVQELQPGTPRWTDTVVGGTRQRLKQVVHLPTMVRRAAANVSIRRGLVADDPRIPAGRVAGPDTSLNPRHISNERRCATARWRLDTIRSVAAANDATVNHVLLTMVAGAYRAELLRRGEEPPADVMTAFGVGLDAAESERMWGNRITPANLPLFVDIADDRERLGTIRDTARPIIEAVRTNTLPSQGAWSNLSHPLVGRLLVAAVNRSPKVFANVVTANVPGPRQRRWFGDVEVTEWISFAILQGSAGPNVTMYSYAGAVTAGVLSAPEFLAAPATFVESMGASLTALAAGRQPSDEPPVASRPPPSREPRSTR